MDTRQVVHAAIRQHFRADAAEALIRDDMLNRVVDELDGKGETSINNTIKGIAGKAERSTLDWMSDRAEIPANWIRARL